MKKLFSILFLSITVAKAQIVSFEPLGHTSLQNTFSWLGELKISNPTPTPTLYLISKFVYWNRADTLLLQSVETKDDSIFFDLFNVEVDKATYSHPPIFPLVLNPATSYCQKVLFTCSSNQKAFLRLYYSNDPNTDYVKLKSLIDSGSEWKTIYPLTVKVIPLNDGSYSNLNPK